MDFKHEVMRIGAQQKASGIMAQFAAADRDIKQQTAAFQKAAANYRFANPFGGTAPHGRSPAHGAGGAHPHKPAKRVTVHPRPPRHGAGAGGHPHPKPGLPAHPKSGLGGHPRPGGVIGGGSHPTPGHPGKAVSVDPVDSWTWWEVLKAVLNGAVRVGEAIILVIGGVGEMVFKVTDALVAACRDIGRHAPPLRGTGDELFAWMAEHWVVSSTGIPLVLGIISGAAFR